MFEILKKIEIKIVLYFLVVVACILFFVNCNHIWSKKERAKPSEIKKTIFKGVINHPGELYYVHNLRALHSFNNPSNSTFLEGYEYGKIHIHFAEGNLFDSIISNLTGSSSIKYLSLNNVPENKLMGVILKFENLIYLKLEECGINNVEEFFDKMAAIKNLKYLDLKDCKINEISYNIGSLKNLVELRIEEDSIWHIHESIGNLRNLEYLSLIGKISELPQSLSKLISIKELDLSYNKFHHFPSQIYQMKSIESINFTGTPIDEVPEKLLELKSLRKVCLLGTQVQEDIGRAKFLEWSISEIERKGNIRVFFHFYDLPMEKLR